MTRTVTATYASDETISNVVDDLVAIGMTREAIYADRSSHQVKVIIPDTISPEIMEILGRHQPTQIN